MVAMSAIQILNKYFNGDKQKSLTEFREEIKALSPEEKQELAGLAAPLVGAELKN